jgi:hypothetical protein
MNRHSCALPKSLVRIREREGRGGRKGRSIKRPIKRNLLPTIRNKQKKEENEKKRGKRKRKKRKEKEKKNR